MATRLFKKGKTPKAPADPEAWNRLLTQVIQRSTLLKDRRTDGLRKVMVAGKAEAHLRRMGIICPADILREFPNPGT